MKSIIFCAPDHHKRRGIKKAKRDPKLLIEKFERLRRCELNSGKPESHPDVMKLSEMIEKLRR